ncbi:MAG: ribulose-phosphate 3-epimerase [Planctomycetaceae bacterium]|nr:ribulose-phosphate 3-epimerase [Planctomycetaceae bacterium]
MNTAPESVKYRFTQPPPTPIAAASVLAADFACLGDDCARVLDEGADMLHVDIMDGHFVPNLSMGPAVCAAVRKACPNAFLDVHLMVTDPGAYLEPFADAGADHCSMHIEVAAPEALLRLRDRCHELGMTAGIAINPETPLERLDPVLEGFDLALVMSVHPGFGGQAFIEDSLEKTRILSSRLRPDQRLEMDGGVSPENAARVIEAGCDVLVAGSAIFRSVDRPAAIRAIQCPET